MCALHATNQKCTTQVEMAWCGDSGKWGRQSSRSVPQQ